MAIIWLWSRRIKVEKSIFENSFEWLLFGPKNMSNRLSGIQLGTKHSSKNNAQMCMSESAGYAAYQRSNDTYENVRGWNNRKEKKKRKKTPNNTKSQHFGTVCLTSIEKLWLHSLIVDRPTERTREHTHMWTYTQTHAHCINISNKRYRKQLFLCFQLCALQTALLIVAALDCNEFP